MTSQTARVRVTRKAEWASRLRPYRIFLDGEDIGGVESGRSTLLRVRPGSHELQLWIDGCCSEAQNFRVRRGETREFCCGCRFGPPGLGLGIREAPSHLLYLTPTGRRH